jgi:hypothetical protein
MQVAGAFGLLTVRTVKCNSDFVTQSTATRRQEPVCCNSARRNQELTSLTSISKGVLASADYPAYPKVRQ